MARYGMVIDETLCNGCYCCFLACRDEYCGNDYPGYSAAQPMTGMNWMRVVEKERGKYPKVKVAYTSIPCMHCDEALCVKMSPDGTVYRRTDGIVVIDPVKAKGRKEIVNTCPYRVIEWNEEKQLPQKCTLCVHLLDQGWKEPRCVEACPTGAIVFGDLDNPQSEVSQRLASGKAVSLHPEYGLKEKVTYIGLPRRFIAGSVVLGDKGKCAENVIVTITNGKDKLVTRTDNYGDFEVEDLAEHKEYTVSLELSGYKMKEMKTHTSIDVYLGDIVLEPGTDKV
jgi:Fe-S-cluster-containing dehydrogenase component